MPDDLHARIDRLEADGEALVAAIEACRKAIVVARALIIVGGVVIAAGFTGIFYISATTALLAFGAVIGGIVWFGANHSTQREARETLKAIEIKRARTIDALDFRGAGTLH